MLEVSSFFDVNGEREGERERGRENKKAQKTEFEIE